MLTGGTAILIALTDLALVRALRTGATGGGDAVNGVAGGTALPPPPPPGAYTAPKSRPVLEPLPERQDRYEPSLSTPAATDPNPAAEPLLPIDPGAVRIRPGGTPRIHLVQAPTDVSVAEPIDPKPVVKIVLRRTDTYHRGAMIDFFC